MGKAFTYKEHYNCDYLLNSLDADGLVPFVYICVSVERGPGKTYSISRWLFNRYFDKKERFVLLVRDKGSLGRIAKGVLSPYIFDNIEKGVVSETIDTSKSFSYIYLDYEDEGEHKKELVGFGMAIKASDDIKKYSGLFSSENVTTMFMDEFQTKTGYLTNEVGRVIDIAESIFRGGETHKAIRDDCRLILSSNCIQFGNPYFTALDLNKNIQSSTRFYRGHGVVFERCEVEDLADMHEKSGVRRAFASFTAKEKENQSTIWVMDNESLVEKVNGNEWGSSYYVCTLSYNGKQYGVHNYESVGYLYISKSVDTNCQYTYAMTIEGNTKNYPLLRNNNLMQRIKNAFFDGTIRVSHGEIQNMLIDCFG